MTVDELKQSIKNKKFVDHTNFPYTFIPANTLRCGTCIHHVVQYQLYENNNEIYFKHANALGPNDKVIKIVQEDPLVLQLIDTCDSSRSAIWTEVQERSYV